jgi:hypothetical protein
MLHFLMPEPGPRAWVLRFDRILPLETRAQAPLKEILTALADGAPSRPFPRSEAEWAHRLTA